MTPLPHNRDEAPSPQKHDAILGAALELFVERGFHGTAVPAVAERAGVGAGTIYRYFENKEALVNALYQKWKTALASRVLEGFPVDVAPREQFQTIWRRMSDFVLEHPRAFAFLELHHHASYLDAASHAIENNVVEFATEFVRRAQAAKALKAVSPAVLMAVVNGAFIGIVRGSWEGRLELSRENLAAAEQCCWDAIRY